MTESQTHRFATGLVSGGQHAAVSLRSPYFFFVGDTAEEVVDLANRALSIYFQASGNIVTKTVAVKSNSTTKSNFRPLENA